MSPEEYDLKIDSLRQEFNEKLRDLSERYAMENNNYCKGDLIRDHMGWGRIIEAEVSTAFTNDGRPCLIFYVQQYTMKKVPFKNETYRWVWQPNIKEYDSNA